MPAETSTPRSELGSVAELLRRRAAERPAQLAFAFLPEAGANDAGQKVEWTYAELDRRARAVAVDLSRVAAPGDRAVLIFPPGLDFIAAFFGCLYAGVLPVPATYPKPRRASSRLDAIVADCKPTAALTTSETLGLMQLDEQASAVRTLEWIAVDRCRDAEAFTQLVPRTPNDAAFLQYTSGSTSQPRGVVVTHGNLLHNLELIRTGFALKPAEEMGPPQSGVFWLPAYHDMGLIGGILTPMYVGGASYLLAPATFLQRPITWLETISRTGAAISGAPNFAYELCARKISAEQRASLDLSRWKLAFCGAEPIDSRALDEFSSAFGERGFRAAAFYACYGLAEATLMVTGGGNANGPRVLHADRAKLALHRLAATTAGGNASQPLVSCGRPLGDQTVRVVNPQTFEPCGDGEIGEIWVSGGSVAKGYWNHPEELWQTFGGRLADGSGPFLRTGDLGAFDNGELFVTGRAKDVIIIRGRNLYPQDVERTAQQAHAAVDLGAAFAVEVDGHEQLVIVHQVRREHRRDDLAPVLRAIRAAIVEEHDVDPYHIVLVRPGGVPLTSSGKVQRSYCRELLASNGLEQLTAWQQSPTAPPVDLLAETATFHPAGNASSAAAGEPAFIHRVAEMSVEELADEVQAWMLGWLEEHAEPGAGELSATAPFAELGMDSLTALELNVEFEKVLGVRLPPAAAWSYPTPALLSRYLAEEMLGVASIGGANGSETDSWFESMEADGRK